VTRYSLTTLSSPATHWKESASRPPRSPPIGSASRRKTTEARESGSPGQSPR
jgi:hypothetical protein